MREAAPLEETAEAFPHADRVTVAPRGRAPDWTETWWFALHDLDSALSVYVHAFVRPELHLTGGGVIVWEATHVSSLDASFSNYQHALPIGAGLVDDDVTGTIEFPTGVSIRVEEPADRYELSYRYKDVVDLSVEFSGSGPVVVDPKSAAEFQQSGHLDQIGTFEGSLALRGATRGIAGVAVRDRSRGRRPDYFGRSRGLGSLQGYAVGVAPSGEEGFVAVSSGADPAEQDLVGGFWTSGGRVRGIRGGTRRVTRHQGRPTGWTVEGVDESGESFALHGTATNQIPLHLLPPTVTWVTRIRWEDPTGRSYIGEDQDVWSLDLWQELNGA